MRKLSFVLPFLSLFVTPAGGTQQPQIDWRSVAILEGTCERIVVAGADRSAECRGPVLNMIYRHGRSSFAFPVGQGLVSFSGTGQAQAGESGRLTLDLVTVARPGASGDPEVAPNPATGVCEFSNPYRGRAYVRCTAQTEAGPFSVSFLSDGRPPEIQQLQP